MRCRRLLEEGGRVRLTVHVWVSVSVRAPDAEGELQTTSASPTPPTNKCNAIYTPLTLLPDSPATYPPTLLPCSPPTTVFPYSATLLPLALVPDPLPLLPKVLRAMSPDEVHS